MDREKLLDVIERRLDREMTYRKVIDEEEVYGAIEKALDEYEENGGVIDGARGKFVVGLRGRLFMDGQHVGWLNKKAGPAALRGFVDIIGSEYPLWTDDFLDVEEKENNNGNQ